MRQNRRRTSRKMTRCATNRSVVKWSVMDSSAANTCLMSDSQAKHGQTRPHHIWTRGLVGDLLAACDYRGKALFGIRIRSKITRGGTQAHCRSPSYTPDRRDIPCARVLNTVCSDESDPVSTGEHCNDCRVVHSPVAVHYNWSHIRWLS
jgi:hypothetical protein